MYQAFIHKLEIFLIAIDVNHRNSQDELQPFTKVMRLLKDALLFSNGLMTQRDNN